MLEILVKSTTTRLVLPATVRDRLGVGSGEDAMLGTIIDEVTSDIESSVGRHLCRQQYRETTFGSDRPFFLLREFPVEGPTDRITASVGGTTVTDHSVHDGPWGVLYREDEWPEDADPDVVLTYWAGYLLPGQLVAWSATSARALSAWTKPTTLSNSPYLFEATTAGTTDATEPTWPTTAGETVADGTVVWTARDARELPAWVSSLALVETTSRYLGRTRDAIVASERVSKFARSYFASASAGSNLTPQVELALRRLRRVA